MLDILPLPENIVRHDGEHLVFPDVSPMRRVDEHDLWKPREHLAHVLCLQRRARDNVLTTLNCIRYNMRDSLHS